MAGALSDAKAQLRRAVLTAREAMAPDTRVTAATRITAQIRSLDAWREARCVLGYLSFGSEIDTAALVGEVLAAGKTLCLPRVVRGERELAVQRVADLERDVQPGVFGIREPREACAPVALDAIDFVLVPGVAFTPRCDRLGYGGGYYDRLIARLAPRPPLVAAAFDLQLREDIPLDTGDRRVDLVVTESAVHCGC